MMTYTEKIQIMKKNKLAGMHPAAKLWLAVFYIICALVLGTVKFTRYKLAFLYIPWFFVVIALSIASGETKKCFKGLKAVLFLAFLIVLVQLFLIPGGDLVWQAGFLKIHEKGLRAAFSIAGTLLCIAGICIWVLQTTSNKEISRALEEAGMNHTFTYVFSSTFQMVTILSDSSKTIMDVQRARGIETDGNMLTRAKAFVPTLIPLILGAIVSAEERVLTLEARGFSVVGERTHLFNLKKSGLEKPVKAASVLITVLVILGRIGLWIV